MNARIYAAALQQALKSASDSEADSIIARFLTLIRKQKREVLLPSIIKAFAALTEKEERDKGVVLTVAHKSDVEKFAHHVTHSPDSFQTRVDSTLIGGYVLTQGGTRTDASYKHTLLHMYHNLTQS